MNETRTSPPPSANLAGHPYVLLVEDDFEDEVMALRILKKYHIANHVDMVRDGDEAIRLLKARLETPVSAGRSPSDSVPMPAKVRGLESPGAGLLPAAEPVPRPTDHLLHGLTAKPGENGAASSATHPVRHGRMAGRAPELVILDYGSSRLAALNAIQSMRAIPGMQKVPVAVCCRTADEERIIRDCALARVSTLSKPFGFFKLLECIQKMDMHWFVFSEKP
jgi:CheY-like chemotaxis protein